jgi:hypothetical protein
MGIDLCRLGLCGSGEKGLRRASATEAIMAAGPFGVEDVRNQSVSGCGDAMLMANGVRRIAGWCGLGRQTVSSALAIRVDSFVPAQSGWESAVSLWDRCCRGLAAGKEHMQLDDRAAGSPRLLELLGINASI